MSDEPTREENDSIVTKAILAQDAKIADLEKRLRRLEEQVHPQPVHPQVGMP